jgi:tetratricopeptide (TPR) repeat protein
MALRLDPMSMIIHTSVGDAYYYARDYERSLVYYRKATDLDPRFDGAHTDLARSLEALGRFDESRKEYEQGRLLSGGVAGPSFGLAHLAFGAWFIVNGAVSWALGVTVLVMLVLGHAAWLWLSPHVRGHMRVPVRVYVLLASLMTACALAAAVHAVGAGSLAVALPALGGVMFCVSDVAVARQQFVKPGPVNRLWGLPLYYLATLLLASAVLAR